MTKKDYIAMARALKEALDDNAADSMSHERVGIQIAANRLSRVLAADNPRFDRQRFLEACGL